MAKVIGLTGGIATGKSTVSNILKEYNFCIVDADVASRKAVEKGSKGLEEVREVFGEKAIINGEMNREYVGSIVFNDITMRKKLNQIIHPKVREIMETDKKECLKNGRNVIMDIPLLFENKLGDTVDETWLVYTEPTIQIERLMTRNQLSKKDATLRIQSQLSIEDKKEMSDYIINNNKDIETLKKNIHDLLLSRGLI